MTILFLCGSLAPGQDGVGDYTRRLAGELVRQGHKAGVVALNDRLTDRVEDTVQNTDGVTVPVLRLPAAMQSKERYARAGKYIEVFNPEWLSLQYVPFSFHIKGLPWMLGRELARIGKGRKWHIMFHELWVGIKVTDNLKYRLWGYLQRQILINLVNNLKPKIINTQTPLYYSLLDKARIKSNLLPLFSNISFSSTSNTNFIEKNYQVSTEIVLLFFGTIHSCTIIEEFLSELYLFQQKQNRKIIIKAIGRNGNEINKWQKAALSIGVNLVIMGEQPEHIIAKELQLASIGVSTTALPMIQKSGTVAAMRECKMPVICLDNFMVPLGVKSPSIPEGIFIFQDNVIEKCLLFEPNNKHFPGLKVVSEMFLNNLSLK